MNPLFYLDTLLEITLNLNALDLMHLSKSNKEIRSLLEKLKPIIHKAIYRTSIPEGVIIRQDLIIPWRLEFSYLPSKYLPVHPTKNYRFFSPHHCLKYAYQEKDESRVLYIKGLTSNTLELEDKNSYLITPLRRRLTYEEVTFALKEYNSTEYEAIGNLLGDYGDMDYFKSYIETSNLSDENKKRLKKGFVTAMILSGNDRMLDAMEKYRPRALEYNFYSAYKTHPLHKKMSLWKTRFDQLMFNIKFLGEEDLKELTISYVLSDWVDVRHTLIRENKRFEELCIEACNNNKELEWLNPIDDEIGYPIRLYKVLKAKGDIELNLSACINFTLSYRDKKEWPLLLEFASPKEIEDVLQDGILPYLEHNMDHQRIIDLIFFFKGYSIELDTLESNYLQEWCKIIQDL